MSQHDKELAVELTNLMPLEGWRKLEEELHALSRMNAGVFDAQGKRLTDYANWGNTLCPRIKSNPDGLQAICACANQVLMRRAAQEERPILEECDAGLVKLLAPVIRDGQFLGVAGCCGSRLQGSAVDTHYIARTTGIPEIEVIRLAGAVPAISRERAEEIVDWIVKRLAAL